MAVHMTEEEMKAAREKAAEIRKISGGVIGQFTPKEIAVDAKLISTSAGTTIGLKVPAGKFVYGAYVKNEANDLASTGAATLTVSVGSIAILSNVPLADLKGKGAAALDTSPDYSATEREVKLQAGTAAYTAGKLIVGVIYG